MNTKRWALLFVCLLSFDYGRVVASAIANNHAETNALVHGGRFARQISSCRVTSELQKVLDDCLDRIKQNLDDSYELTDTELDSYVLTGGVASGFKNFVKVGPYQCSCGRNYARVHIKVSFVKILVTYLMSLLDDLLSGLLNSLGTALARLIGNVVDLVVRVLCLEIQVRITILQRFVPGTKCIVESYRVTELKNIQLLNLDLRFLADILSPLLTPVLDFVLQIIFTGKVKAIFVREFHKVTISKDSIICH